MSTHFWNAVPAKFLKTAHGIYDRAFAAWMGLRIKLIGIAYHLFLQHFGHEVLMGQGQLLLFDIPL